MAENVMYICGCSMEMEMAKEMGWVGKCIGCLYTTTKYDDGDWYCTKRKKKTNQENCPEWVVDHR